MNWECKASKAKLKGPSSLGSRTSFGAPAQAQTDPAGGINLLFCAMDHARKAQWSFGVNQH